MLNPERAELISSSLQKMDRRRFLRLSALAAGSGFMLAATTPSILLPSKAEAASVISPLTRETDRVFSEVEASRIVLPAFLPTEAQESGWIEVGPDPGELNQDQWFPFAKLNGQRVLHAPGGFLDKIGRIQRRQGQQVDPRGHEEQYAADSLQLGGAIWRGHCHATANTMAYQEPLIIGKEESFEYEEETINWDNIIEAYTNKHSPDAEIALRRDTVGKQAILRAAIIKGWTPVASCPDPGREDEDWMYAIKIISPDLQYVVGYNFGLRRIFPIERIKLIYLPGHYNFNNPDSVNSIDDTARRGTAGYGNGDLDYDRLDHMVLNIPADQPLP